MSTSRLAGWAFPALLGLGLALLPLSGTTSSDSEVPTEAALRREAEALEGLLALIALREGERVFEEYFDGTSPDSLLHLRSGTKSVMSLLVGIALDRGLLRSVDQTLGELLGPAVRRFGSEKAGLSVRHLLTMTTGLSWNELADVQEFNRLVSSAEPMAFYLRRSSVSAPGETWAYSSGASHLLSIVLGEVTGMRASDFAREALFSPLGIDRYRWASLRDGHSNGAAGLELRPSDFLKVGELMLAGGTFDGRRVVSRAWVAESTRTHMSLAGDTNYGYHWWVGPAEPTRSFAARGFGGQALIVLPEYATAIVANCRWRGLARSPSAQSSEVMQFVGRRLAPFVVPELASQL